MRTILFICMALLGAIIHAQTPIREYLDIKHQISDSSSSVYYREITYDNTGKPVGLVKEYFSNGILHWEGKFSEFNKNIYSECEFHGKCSWYYPSGKIKKSISYNLGIPDGKAEGWYENGKMHYEFNYTDGTVDGLFLQWYDSGLLKSYAALQSGEVINNQAINCDEFGKCYTNSLYSFIAKQKKYEPSSYTSFTINAILGEEVRYTCCGGSSRNIESGLSDASIFEKKSTTNGIKAQIKHKSGLMISAKSMEGCIVQQLPISYDKEFNLRTLFTIQNKKDRCKSGLVFAYEDFNNYEFIKVDGFGNYQIGIRTAGLDKIQSEGKITMINKSSKYRKGRYHYKKSNTKSIDIAVVSDGDTLQFMNGYQLLFKRAVLKGRGGQVGYFIGPHQLMEVKYLQCRNEISPPFLSFDVQSQKIEKPWRWSGSGFFVSKEGYLVTNHHVIEDAQEIEAEILRNGAIEHYACEVIIADEKSDLAVIKIKDPSFSPLTQIPYRIRTDLANVGDNIFTLGYPLAMSSLGNEIKFTEGTVNARTGYKGELLAYQISAPIQPGNSGGPLFNQDGDVIGVVNSKIMGADNVAFAIKSNYIFNLFNMLPSNIKSGEASLSGLTAADQVNVLKEYVALIKVR